jgi:hypothetical protein
MTDTGNRDEKAGRSFACGRQSVLGKNGRLFCSSLLGGCTLEFRTYPGEHLQINHSLARMFQNITFSNVKSIFLRFLAAFFLHMYVLKHSILSSVEPS